MWTNEYRIDNNFARDTTFNLSLALDIENMNDFITETLSFFDSILKFTEQISSVTLYPFAVPTGSKHKLVINNVGYVNIDVKTIDTDRYFNLGQLQVPKYFYNFADLNGYTNAKLFLPLLGFVDVDVNEIMGKVLQVRLVVDYNSGKGIYLIGVSDTPITHENAGFSTWYEDRDVRIVSTFEVDVGISIPLGSTSLTDLKRNIAIATVKAASVAVVPELAVPIALAPTPNTGTSTSIAVRNNNSISTLQTIQADRPTTSRPAMQSSGNMSGVFEVAHTALNRTLLHGTSDRVADSSLTVALSGKPKLVIYRPKIIEQSADFNHLYGKPLGSVKQLDLVHGYTEISKAHFEGVGFASATAEEMSAIESFFSNGVILP